MSDVSDEVLEVLAFLVSGQSVRMKNCHQNMDRVPAHPFNGLDVVRMMHLVHRITAETAENRAKGGRILSVYDVRISLDGLHNILKTILGIIFVIRIMIFEKCNTWFTILFVKSCPSPF